MEPITTGVPGLDQVLHGGLRPRGLHVLGGLPGTGKTTLAQQISYHHARAGGKVLYLVALSETAERLVGHASSFGFFDPTMVAHRIYYISVYPKLEEGGLPAVLDEVRMLAVEHKASMVCIDGMSTLKSAAPTPLDFRRFMFDLNAQTRSLGATTLVVGPWVEWEASDPEFVIADGILTMSLEPGDDASTRYMEVLKLRGSDHLPGRHTISISREGVAVFPRLEAALRTTGLKEPPSQWTLLNTGTEGLDQMLHGGIPSGSITWVTGAPGVGKTVLGLSFLAEGARRGERGLYLGFDEAPSRLTAKADALGLGMGKMVESGMLRLHWSPPLDLIPDSVAWDLLSMIDETDARRVVVDGADAMMASLTSVGRTRSFVTALMGALRGRDVTAIMTHDQARLPGVGAEICQDGVATMADNILVLQYVELRSELHRLISILKVRDGDFDPSIREFKVSRGGLQVANTFGSAEAVLTGIGHWRGRRAQ